MRKIFFLAVVVLSHSGMLTSCSGDIMNRESLSSEGVSLSSQASEEFVNSAEAVEEMDRSMVSFVDKLRGYYSQNMTYQQFKQALDPVTGLSSITKEGDDLLYSAYGYLKTNASVEQIKGKEMAIALHFILQHNLSNGLTDYSQIDFVASEKLLFGLSDDYIAQNRAGCKWYQLGCHLSNFWKWFTSPSSGGSGSNGSNLISLINLIISIIKMF